MKELEGYIPATVGVYKYMKSMITQGKDMLIKNGLIKKNRNASMYGKKDSGAHLA
jgi:hypothetical protein